MGGEETGGRAAVIWRIVDGKPGHENQSAGLAEALAELAPVKTLTLAAPSRLRAAAWWAAGRFPIAAAQPAPSLIIGAGHATHLPMLAARRSRSAHVVALMKPSLPIRCFDLCLIPRHDGVPESSRVIPTWGAPNRARAGTKNAGRGLILVGGPSRRHGWNHDALLGQIATALQDDPRRLWTLATSRRTPSAFLERLRQTPPPQLEVAPWEETAPGWLPGQLAAADRVWVTEDSVSMIYEGLTAGAAVGLLAVPRKQTTRVERELDRLAARGWVTRFDDWRAGQPLQPPSQPFNEARRCAQEILNRWTLTDR